MTAPESSARAPRRTAPNSSAQDLTPRPDGPQAFRWALAGLVGPPLTHALAVGEAVRGAIYKAAEQRGIWPLPDAFHRDDDPAHTHAFWLSEDADRDGRIDHVLLFCEGGLPAALVPALAADHSIWLGSLGAWTLAPDWMGRRGPGALFGPARLWLAHTAYVPARWRRRDRGPRRPGGTKRGGRPRPDISIEEALAREIVDRGLPLPRGIELTAGVGDDAVPLPAQGFVHATVDRQPPGDAVPVGALVYFDEPVWGPLAVGFGCHFGLGLFEPQMEGE
jgi:CRISPR-associated protein Csb2